MVRKRLTGQLARFSKIGVLCLLTLGLGACQETQTNQQTLATGSESSVAVDFGSGPYAAKLLEPSVGTVQANDSGFTYSSEEEGQAVVEVTSSEGESRYYVLDVKVPIEEDLDGLKLEVDADDNTYQATVSLPGDINFFDSSTQRRFKVTLNSPEGLFLELLVECSVTPGLIETFSCSSSAEGVESVALVHDTMGSGSTLLSLSGSFTPSFEKQDIPAAASVVAGNWIGRTVAQCDGGLCQ